MYFYRNHVLDVLQYLTEFLHLLLYRYSKIFLSNTPVRNICKAVFYSVRQQTVEKCWWLPLHFRLVSQPNLFQQLKVHNLIGILTHINFFEKSIILPTVAILKKKLKIEKSQISRKWLNIFFFFFGVKHHLYRSTNSPYNVSYWCINKKLLSGKTIFKNSRKIASLNKNFSHWFNNEKNCTFRISRFDLVNKILFLKFYQQKIFFNFI